MPWCLENGLHTRFQALKDTLFSRDTTVVLSLSVCRTALVNASRISSSTITSAECLINHLAQEAGSLDYDTIIVIPQEYSWGRLQIMDSVFQEVMNHLNVFADLLIVATAYGIKTHEDERMFHGWRSCCSQDHCSKTQHEICYNIAYVEKHHRKLDDPWSLRQTGAYQQLHNDRQSSKYIMFNLTNQTKRLLEKSLDSRSHCCHLAVHAELLVLLGSNWLDYVEYLSMELMKHNDKACYSSIDRPDKHDFIATYQSLQELHMLRTKIERATWAIDCCVKIGRGCRKHSEVHATISAGYSTACSECLGLIETHGAELTEQLQRLQRLDRRLRDILDQLSKVLMFRNEVLLQNCNRQSSDTLSDLLTITGQNRVHQKTLTQLFRAVKADSVLLKALSMMATAYLPASLIATVYASNLVQLIVPSGERQPTHLALSPDFWTYVAISLPLIGLTLLWTVLLDRRSHQKAAKKAEAAENS